MGVVNFLPIQDGTGDASPKNVRPIRAPLDIDGIGKVYGGSIDTVTGELVDGYKKVVITKAHVWAKQGTTGWYRANDGLLPSGSSSLNQNDKCFCNNLTKRLGQASIYFGIIFGYSGTNRVVVTGSQSEYPTSEALSAYLASIGTYYVIPVTTTKTYHLTTAQLHQAIEQLKTYFDGILPVANMTDIRRRIIMDTPHIVTPTPAELHTFSTDMVAPLKDCVIHFEPVQEGEGDPSPENVRNITGWTGLRLHKGGKNLFDLSWYVESGWKVSDGEQPDSYWGRKHAFYYLNGQANNDPSTKGLFGKLLPLGRVCISLYKYFDNVDRIYFHYEGDTEWENHTGNTTATGERKWISTINKLCDGVALVTTQGATANGYFGKFQIEIGDEKTEYSTPSTTIPVDWTDTAGTLHGGTYNLLTGELVQTWDIAALSPNKTWTEARNGLYYSRFDELVRCADYRGHLIANNMPTSKADNDLLNVLPSITAYRESSSYKGQNWIYVAIDPEVVYTVDMFKQWLTDHPITIAYELKTPIVYHLPPLNLKTLHGVNNIWSNANGNIDLSYWTH